MSNQGVVMFAYNNNTIDYIKQSIFAAVQVKKILNLPVSLVTSAQDSVHLHNKFKKYSTVFQHVIINNDNTQSQLRDFYNGALNKISDQWHNQLRSSAYALTPYEETLVMDTDFIIGNKNLLKCFHSKQDFLINQHAKYINRQHKPEYQIENMSDTGIKMYWATVFFFRKTPRVQKLFELIAHIKLNWAYYRFIWTIHEKNFRNDYAFSMALHEINHKQRSFWPQQLPDSLFYITDRDVAVSFKDNRWHLQLITAEGLLDTSAANINLHVMNKFSLDGIINSGVLQ